MVFRYYGQPSVLILRMSDTCISSLTYIYMYAYLVKKSMSLNTCSLGQSVIMGQAIMLFVLTTFPVPVWPYLIRFWGVCFRGALYDVVYTR